jgi:hypothetical protein
VTDLELVVDQGSDFRRLIKIKNEARELIDISDRVFIGGVKQDYRSTKSLFEISLEISDQETNRGELHLHIAANETRDLRISAPTEYYYDIKQIKDDEETILLSGKLVVVPRVNK